QPCRLAAGCGHEQKLQRSMNRKECFPVLDGDEGVDRRSIQKRRSKPGASMVQRKAARHHHGHPPTGACQSERSFDKQLIEICVSVTLPSVCARLAGKRRECGVAECTRSAKHFPGWVSD